MPYRVFVLGSILLLAGCNSAPKAAETKGAEDEYIYVTATGSNVPKRVKKSDLVKGTVAKELDTQQISKEDFAKSLRTGRQIERRSN